MVNTWFTSDFHFGHRNIIQYCNRPFASTGEMDAAILANLNRQIGENDQLHFLGDFCIGGPEKQGNTVIASCAGTFTLWKVIMTARFAT